MRSPAPCTRTATRACAGFRSRISTSGCSGCWTSGRLLRWKTGQGKTGQRNSANLAWRAASSRLGQAVIGGAAPFAVGAIGGGRAALDASLGRSRIRFACRPLQIDVVERFGAEFDELWERLKPQHDVVTERTAAVLNWRHIDPPSLLGRSYALSCREGGQLLGYVALREPATTAPGHFILTDLFYDVTRSEIMHNLMNAAFDFVAGRSASVLEVFGLHPSINEALRTQNPYVLRRLQLERLGRGVSLRNILTTLARRSGDVSSATYWYRAPSPELQQICAAGAWWPSGIDGDLNL